MSMGNKLLSISMAIISLLILVFSQNVLASSWTAFEREAYDLYSQPSRAYSGTVHERQWSKLHSESSQALLQGDYVKAIEYEEKAYAYAGKYLGREHLRTLQSAEQLANMCTGQGQDSKGIMYYKETLRLSEKLLGKCHRTTLDTLAILGYSYNLQGNYGKAEPILKECLQRSIKRVGKEHPYTVTCMNNLALFYSNIGRDDEAEKLYKETLELSKKVKGRDHADTLSTMYNLAMVYRVQNRYDEAEKLLIEELQINKRKPQKNTHTILQANNGLAYIYLAQNRLEEAYKFLKDDTFGLKLGRYYLAKKMWTKAEKQFQKALKETKSWELPYFDCLIASHTGLGLTAEGKGDLDAAKGHFQKAIDLIEKQWKMLMPSARRNFLTAHIEADFIRMTPFEAIMRVVLKEGATGCEAEALKYAEMVKSRLFLEQLAAKEAHLADVKDQKILDKDRELQQRVSESRRRLEALENSRNASPGDKANALNELNQASAVYETFLNEIKLSGSEAASLIAVEPVKAETLQSLLDGTTTLLEYYLAEDNIYAWLITKDHIKVYKINADEKEFSERVNKFRLANISNKSRRPAPVMPIGLEHSEKETSKSDLSKNRTAYDTLAQAFYQTLISPLEEDIKTEKLIIVPHGALHKIPFASLNDGDNYLIDKYAISVLPAAGVMQYIVKKRNPDHRKFLAFSNPVTAYVSLPYAEAEVDAVKGLFAQKEVYAHEKATELAAKKKSSSADIIHFACHGEFNDNQPLQSGLVLAKDSANDGFLQVHELFGLNLKEANLVALSACETALGKIQGGDDMVGLSRGFIYAGTPSLLATLWQVDDRATAVFMEKFYDNWQNKRMSKPEALRQAQLEIKAMPQYAHAYYWAPFVMIGDWM